MLGVLVKHWVVSVSYKGLGHEVNMARTAVHPCRFASRPVDGISQFFSGRELGDAANVGASP